MSVPYQDAGSAGARAEITKILKRFGCESIGFMDDFAAHEVLLAFQHRGRAVQHPASQQKEQPPMPPTWLGNRWEVARGHE